MIFDIIIAIVLGHYEPHPYKTENLLHKCVCSEGLTTSSFPIILLFLGPVYSLGHINIEIKQLVNIEIKQFNWCLNVTVKGRIAHLSL